MSNDWQYSTYSKIDSQVKQNFPFAKPRVHQLETISEIKEAIDKRYKYIVLEAGTGTGKSVIAATLASMYDSTYILTITKQLQDQYQRDFKDLGFKVVKGRGNFKCKKYAEEKINNRCDEGRCVLEGYNCEYSTKRKSPEKINKSGTCEYEYQKWIAINSDVVISNYHYMFLELNYNQDFNKRKLLVCDEAHNLEDTIMHQLKLEFTRKELKEYGINLSKDIVTRLNEGNYSDWIEFIKKIEEKYSNEYDKIKKLKKSQVGEKVSYLKRRIEDCSRFIKHIRHDPQKWIFDYDSYYGVCEFKPIQIDNYAEKNLFDYADTCLFMSATILDYKLFAKWLGINENEIYAIRRESPFEVNRNPIKTYSAFNMSYNKLSKSAQDTIPVIKEILESHKNDKGIIHTVSHQCKNFLMKNLDNTRLIDHKTRNRARQLKKFKKSKKPLVFISPSMNEGVDLPGSQCRFQIIYKIPYPSLADKQTKLRKSIDKQWYEYKTALALVQTYGRGMRYEKDYCKTYFIDSRLTSFVGMDEARNHFLPDSFKKAINITPAVIDDAEEEDYVEEVEFKDIINEKINFESKQVYNVEVSNVNDDMSYSQKVDLKYALTLEGQEFIDNKQYDEAIEFYNRLLTHELFVNDYHPYRKLSRVYRKDKQFKKEVEILVKFFKSGIYCDDKQLKWFKKRLKQLSKYDNFDYSTIDELEKEYHINGANNKDLANIPVPIAVKIKKSKKKLKKSKDDAMEYSEKYFRNLAKEVSGLPDFISDRELSKLTQNDFILLDNYNDTDKKADLINEGKELEKEDVEEAIKFYEDLKSNRLFVNDYYPYRRQCIIFKNKIKDDQRDWNTIVDFFSKGIYCNDHQYIWFKNKISELVLKLDLNDDEINKIKSLLKDFDKNRELYEKMQDVPVPIAERIKKDDDGLKLISFEKYNQVQNIYYIKELGVGYIRRGEYETAIEYYANLLNDDLLYFRYHAYKQFARIFKEMKNYNQFKKLYEAHVVNHKDS